jgi:methionyl-tRNA formyltransferase
MRVAILCNDRVALPAFDYLVGNNVVVAAGMPDRMSETQSIVSAKCKAAGISFQLFNKKKLDDDLPAWLNKYQPDVVLVKTFPFRIPAHALGIPNYGFINFHYAPLPAWRGANPLFWMLRNGEKEAGITVHLMNSNYDEGDILLEQPILIGHNINFGILYSQLALAGVGLTAQLIININKVFQQRKQQDHTKANWYGHPTLTDLFIDWQKMNAHEIVALVKACNPWNKGAGTRWKEWTFGITYASIADHLVMSQDPGTILSINANDGFTIASRDGKAVIAEVVYCEEGFYPGYCLSAFGLQKNDCLG